MKSIEVLFGWLGLHHVPSLSTHAATEAFEEQSKSRCSHQCGLGVDIDHHRSGTTAERPWVSWNGRQFEAIPPNFGVVVGCHMETSHALVLEKPYTIRCCSIVICLPEMHVSCKPGIGSRKPIFNGPIKNERLHSFSRNGLFWKCPQLWSVAIALVRNRTEQASFDLSTLLRVVPLTCSMRNILLSSDAIVV